MTKLNRPEINISGLTAELRKATAPQVVKSDVPGPKHDSTPEGTDDPQKPNSMAATSLSPATDLAPSESESVSHSKLPRLDMPSVFVPHDHDDYHINDLLKFHDVDFVNAAYLAILKRKPDRVGSDHYLEQLRGGHLDKVDIVASLRFSPEGELRNVRVEGLAIPHLIRRLGHLPFIGYLIRLSVGLLRLPVLMHRWRRQEAYSFAQNRKVADYLNEVADYLNNELKELRSDVQAQMQVSLDDVRASLERVSSAGIELVTDLKAKIRQVEAFAKETAKEIGARTDRVESDSNETRADAAKTLAQIERLCLQLEQSRAEVALQERRMALILEEVRSRLPGPFDQQQLEIIATEEQHKLDALYAELEDNFRGSHEEIKERFRTYLPHIKSLVITGDMPIVDLGCGRGEWLELLKEEGYRALGVDTNSVLLDRCRARGLDVIESDALRYLRGLPDDGLSAITGFHIIEHLEIEVLMKLLDEIVRVLHPGGVVIFETPNPENVLVGSNYFYFDPTHRNPLPSLLMNFLLTSRGLQRIEVMNLHAWDQARIGGKNELTARFNKLFYGPMDYAIAGWKVSE